MTDTKIKLALAIYVVAATLTLIASFAGYIDPFFLACLNLLTATILAGRWLWRYLRYPHLVEQREIIFLGAELICLTLSMFFICTSKRQIGLRSIQYLFSIVHLLTASGLLVFFLLFKIKKLF